MEDMPIDEDELWHFIEKAVRQACEQFVNARIIEGENLKKDLLSKLDNMSEIVAFIEKRSPEIIKEYRSKLENKVAELLKDTTIDENRIATEVIIYADKICVDEETVRLRSHIDHAKKCLFEEGGTIDPCYFTDFFDCNILKILFCQKGQKGFVHSGCSSKISAF